MSPTCAEMCRSGQKYAGVCVGVCRRAQGCARHCTARTSAHICGIIAYGVEVALQFVLRSFDKFFHSAYYYTVHTPVYDRTEPLPNLEPNLEPNRSVRFGGDTEVRPNLFFKKNHHLLSGQLRYTTRGVFDNFPRCGLPAGARARAG